MAQAILMGKDGGGSGKGIKVLEASTDNVVDFNTLVAISKACSLFCFLFPPWRVGLGAGPIFLT